MQYNNKFKQSVAVITIKQWVRGWYSNQRNGGRLHFFNRDLLITQQSYKIKMLI